MTMSHVYAFLNRSIVGAKLLQIHKCFLLCNRSVYLDTIGLYLIFSQNLYFYIDLQNILRTRELMQFLSFHNQVIRCLICITNIFNFLLLIYASTRLSSCLNCTVHFLCVFHAKRFCKFVNQDFQHVEKQTSLYTSLHFKFYLITRTRGFILRHYQYNTIQSEISCFYATRVNKRNTNNSNKKHFCMRDCLRNL